MTEPTVDPDRLLALLTDTQPHQEPLHPKDCPACDVAIQVVGELQAYWDPNETWHDTPAIHQYGLDTMATEATRVVAWVLHRRMPGHSGGRR